MRHTTDALVTGVQTCARPICACASRCPDFRASCPCRSAAAGEVPFRAEDVHLGGQPISGVYQSETPPAQRCCHEADLDTTMTRVDCMDSRSALTLSIGVLGGVAVALTATVITVPIWVVFLSWASFFFVGGGPGGWVRSVSWNV